MNTTLKTVIVSAIAAIVVAGGLWLMLPAKEATVATSYGNTSIDGSQTSLPTPSNYDYLVARLAFGLGTNLSNSNTGAGNINMAGQKANLLPASTTVCAILNPFSATSTVQSFSINVTTSTSTATSFAIGTSTNAFATSSSMVTGTIGSGATGVVTWDPGANNGSIGPGQYVTVGNATGQVFYPFAVGGTCQATFQTAT